MRGTRIGTDIHCEEVAPNGEFPNGDLIDGDLNDVERCKEELRGDDRGEVPMSSSESSTSAPNALNPGAAILRERGEVGPICTDLEGLLNTFGCGREGFMLIPSLNRLLPKSDKMEEDRARKT